MFFVGVRTRCTMSSRKVTSNSIHSLKFLPILFPIQEPIVTYRCYAFLMKHFFCKNIIQKMEASIDSLREDKKSCVIHQSKTMISLAYSP